MWEGILGAVSFGVVDRFNVKFKVKSNCKRYIVEKDGVYRRSNT